MISTVNHVTSYINTVNLKIRSKMLTSFLTHFWPVFPFYTPKNQSFQKKGKKMARNALIRSYARISFQRVIFTDETKSLINSSSLRRDNKGRCDLFTKIIWFSSVARFEASIFLNHGWPRATSSKSCSMKTVR